MAITIPHRGVPRPELLERMKGFRKEDADWRDGRTFSLVYHAGEEHEETLKAAYELFFSENFLNPMAFQSLKKMEAEVVRMTAAMVNGGPDVVGTMTSGGTESILLAVKTARDRARSKNKKLGKPNVVAPETIHPAFDKAAQYFGLEMRFSRLTPGYRADVKDLETLIDANTVLIAASAPQYPHGVIDPIGDIAELALRRGLPFHVDACVGGFVLPWIERLGHPLPRWDFRVKGVTSMSADVHKYGFTTKGASVVLYRDMSYLRHQFFVSTDFPGGIYASPTIAGTRPGGAIAAAWASLMTLGEEGFLDHARRALEATKIIAQGIAEIPELELIVKPDATIVAWRARPETGLDTYVIADQLTDRDWLVDRQHHPACIHCTVTSNHLPHAADYVKDVAAAVAYVKAHPELESRGNAAMYGMMAKIPFRGVVKTSVLDVMEKMYGPNAAEGGGDPLAAGEDDGVVMKLVKSYGSRALAVIDRAQALRDKLPWRPKRRAPIG
jgi:glutamate/tyrosine decarboxylase-like PLP-dependent enzyme